MNCPVHPQAEVTGPCVRCGVGYCDGCLVTLQNERFCASCKDDERRDVLSGGKAASGLAGGAQRVGAYVIDLFLLWLLPTALSFLQLVLGVDVFYQLFRGRGRIAQSVFVALLYFVYEGVLVARRGQTLGKMAANIRVTGADGSPVTPTQAWTRAGIRMATGFASFAFAWSGPFFSWLANVALALIDDIPGLLTAERTAIHDLLARTRVKRVER